MNKEIKTKNLILAYRIKKSARARYMRISVARNSAVTVTLPWGIGELAAEEFVKAKLDWIVRALDYFKRFSGRVVVKSGKREFLKHRTAALELAHRKIAYWNRIYGFSYCGIRVKNQKTLWASCSHGRNLNFNYQIIHLPENLVDYLVVHELCHLKEFNHSRSFWELVAKTQPEYKRLRKQLKSVGIS